MNQILTDDEIYLATVQFANKKGLLRCEFDDETIIEFLREYEQAILNKLSAQEPVCYGNQTALDNMLDDRVAEVAGVRDGWRKTPLYLHPAPSVPEGYQLVPIEPTEAMMWALYGHWVGQLTHLDYEYYKAMLSAARSE